MPVQPPFDRLPQHRRALYEDEANACANALLCHSDRYVCGDGRPGLGMNHGGAILIRALVNRPSGDLSDAPCLESGRVVVLGDCDGLLQSLSRSRLGGVGDAVCVGCEIWNKSGDAVSGGRRRGPDSYACDASVSARHYVCLFSCRRRCPWTRAAGGV